MHGRIARVTLLLLFAAVTSCDKESSKPPAVVVNNAVPAVARTTDEGPGLVLLDSAPGDLGEADYGAVKSCVFRVRNDTRGLVTLQIPEKSCACTGVEVKPARIAPGEICQVTLGWAPKLELTSEQDVRVWAVLQDRDGRCGKVRVEAKGRLRPALHINLPRYRLDFGRIALGDLDKGKELAIEVFTRDAIHKGFKLQATSSNPGLQLAPNEPTRLEADRLAQLKAVDGYRITVQCREGLPIGKFRETIYLQSSLYPDHDLELGVEGQIDCGAVSLSSETLQLPNKIPLEKGYHCPPLEITLRGQPNRALKVVDVQPKFLAAELIHKKANVWQLRVRVPAGEKELRKLVPPDQLDEYLSYGFESGMITLHTDHSLLPVLKIPVSGSQLTQ